MSTTIDYSGMKPTHVVEAALFSAGRALGIEEIAEQTGLARPAIRQAIDALIADYKERDTVLEVGKAGTKWGMQVKTVASEPAARFAPMEIPKKLLKTLALIAYHQPLKQSELGDMVGSKVYEHVRELKERGLIRTRRDGITKILTTTPEFPEYFGLDAATPDEIRVVLAKMVGLEPIKKDGGQGSLERFAKDTVDEHGATEAPPSDEKEETTPSTTPEANHEAAEDQMAEAPVPQTT